MAKKRYRILTEQFWTDVKIEEMSFEEKSMYAYLITNPYTNGCGCYEVTLRQIAAQTGLTVKAATALITALQDKYKVIHYYEDTCEMLIYKFGRHNWSDSPKLLQGARNDAVQIKNMQAAEFIRQALEEGVNGRFEPPMDEPRITQRVAREKPRNERTERMETVPESMEPERMQAEPKELQKPQAEPPWELADVEAVPLNDGSEWRPTREQYEEYKRLFPAVDIDAEFRLMRAWCQANRTKRKTKSGVMRFVQAWLSRTQNRPQNKPQTAQQPRKPWQVANTSNYNVDDLERQLLAN